MNTKNNYNLFSEAANLINQADALLICAGAGMGVDSGLPDFRGNHGFWKAYPALEQEGLSFIDLANPQGFYNNPNRAWGFYGHRYHLYNRTTPHEGFHLLKKWCSIKSNPCFVFTSNVDGHFQKAGFRESQIFECHGSINHLQCSGNNDRPCTGIWESINDLNLQILKINTKNLTAMTSLPKCPKCTGLARPNILMFDDYYWQPTRGKIQEDRFHNWRDNLLSTNQKIVVIEIGAGTAIPSVRLASESMNTAIIRINPRESQGSSNVLSIDKGALESLIEIDKFI